MALPIILLGAAAVLLASGGKKKKSSSGTSASYKTPPNSPPALPKKTKKTGSGYSNVTRERMQWIQTSLAALGYDVGPKGMDGRYGPDTKAAVWEFQVDHNNALGNPDGKPGKNTQAMLEQALANRDAAQSQGQAPQDECDPLDPSTWGPGNVCVLEGGRWKAVPEGQGGSSEPDWSAIPKTPHGYHRNDLVLISPDLSNIHIGQNWRYKTLEPWLMKQKEEDKVGLSDAKKTLEWITENIVVAPSNFLGAGNETVGGIIYAVLITIATAGAAKGYLASALGASTGATVAAKAVVWLGTADLFAGMAGLFNVFTATPRELLQAQMMVLINEFAEMHMVLVGDKWMHIKDIPLDNPATDQLLEHLMEWVAKFQRYQFDD